MKRIRRIEMLIEKREITIIRTNAGQTKTFCEKCGKEKNLHPIAAESGNLAFCDNLPEGEKIKYKEK